MAQDIMAFAAQAYARPLEASWKWKERTSFSKLSDDCHLCAIMCTPWHMYPTYTGNNKRALEMAQWVKALVTKTGDLTLTQEV